MSNIQQNINYVCDLVSQEEILSQAEKATACNKALYDGGLPGSDFLGWVSLPSSISEDHLKDIEHTAKELRTLCDVVVVVGIGGSYLGARAVIDALSNSFDWLQEADKRKNPVILYAGNNISEDYLHEMLHYLKDKRFGLINISKSGTTTEPALAFRLLKDLLEEKAGKGEARKRIVAITDASHGALRTLANTEGYKTFIIPDDIGGRYSVLTPVGLLPIAVAGFDIRNLVKGAQEMKAVLTTTNTISENPAMHYAALRNAFYEQGKKIEIMVNYDPRLYFLTEWWKQLYGESEGKEGKGIFPAGVNNTSDLHSMGQYIQEGERLLFETVLSVENNRKTIEIPSDSENLDGMNFVAGKRMGYVNSMAQLGTILAHIDGGVPSIKISIPEISEYTIGQLIYFYEFGCGLSGYLLGVNPFDQPGVEAYKKNMFKLLGK
jgi:glucose-6-phosphate isomerase